jgi:hypothetical protein
MDMSKFSITGGKGFFFPLSNGWAVSVQFGYANYCNNERLVGNYSDPEVGSCTNAEVAAVMPNGDLWHNPVWGDQVKGYCTPQEVLDFINQVATFK